MAHPARHATAWSVDVLHSSECNNYAADWGHKLKKGKDPQSINDSGANDSNHLVRVTMICGHEPTIALVLAHKKLNINIERTYD